MQVRTSFFVASLVCVSLAVACGDNAAAPLDDDIGDDDGDDDAPSTSSSSGGGSSGTSSSGGSSSGGSSGGSSSSSGGSSGSSSGNLPVRPDDCEILPTGSFANGPALTPRQYGAQPTFRGSVDTPTGQPELDDLLHVRIDAATDPGSYELAPIDGNDNCYEDNAQCVYLHEDLFEGASNRFFVATRGRLRIDAQITTDQSQGVLEYVELRESTLGSRNVPFNQSHLVQNGRCLWIENAAFDTRRVNGCNPQAADPCPAGSACIRENAAGTDGTCQTSTGGGTNGASCSRDQDGNSNCGLEYMCSEEGAAVQDRKCRRLCDLFAADNVCPTNTICGPFGYCEPPTAQVDDTVVAGDACNPQRFFCGPDGARGVCFNALDEAQQQLPEGPLCHKFEASRAACPAGQELGYLPFSGYEDRSFAACVPRNY